MPRILNKYKDAIPEGAVYIGRPSIWGNPFIIGKDGTREEVIAKYRRHILGNPGLLSHLYEIRGKDLICFCAPQPCHGDVLLELANRIKE